MKNKIKYKFWQVVVGMALTIAATAFLAAILFYSFESDPKKRSEAFDSGSGSGDWLRFIQIFFYLATFVYFTLNYYYNLIARNKPFLSFLKITVIIEIFSFAYLSLLYFLLPHILHKTQNSLGRAFLESLITSVPLFIFCYFFAYVTVLREAMKQKKVLEAQHLLLEAQISQANFNFLKAQINPHFLHNTLNFLYAKSLPYSSELREGILTLSDIMRYALDQGNQRDGKAPLEDEIEHVRNVIKINQLRYRNKLKVNLEISGAVNGVCIIPFVLITLVENAFKHGDLKSEDCPIDFKLNVDGNKLYFYCRNKKKTGPKPLSTGIGLENIKKRLDIAYADRYKLIVKDEPEFYLAELTIYEL